MRYNLLNVVFLAVMLFASARGYAVLYLFTLATSLAIYLYLLVSGRMLPNSKTGIYGIFLTQYDEQRRSDYIERNYNLFDVLFYERYSSATLILFYAFAMFSCNVNGRTDLLLLTLGALVVLQVFHIVVSYRSVMRDG